MTRQHHRTLRPQATRSWYSERVEPEGGAHTGCTAESKAGCPVPDGRAGCKRCSDPSQTIPVPSLSVARLLDQKLSSLASYLTDDLRRKIQDEDLEITISNSLATGGGDSLQRLVSIVGDRSRPFAIRSAVLQGMTESLEVNVEGNLAQWLASDEYRLRADADYRATPRLRQTF